MKVIKQASFLLVMFILMASFSQCSSSQKLQNKPPTEFGQVYYQYWAAGIKDGGSGVNIYIPVTDTSIALDSVYFKGKMTKLELSSGNKQLYIGLFRTHANQVEDVILSSDSKEEYANKMPMNKTSISFDLNDDECVVSYQKRNKTQYYKISNIKQKAPINFPSAPPNEQ
ncbi:hypothetical protein [uncultured Psychroserpens sp.]|uniref:hypothetical protein n=1 Tax=uncultured Psychroserpens sp. TaxID=255436 RepID=UPI002630B2ED|nr:hypothetical protein [uncultured Psychroserpens sp.]